MSAIRRAVTLVEDLVGLATETTLAAVNTVLGTKSDADTETTMIGRYGFADAVTTAEGEFQTAADHMKANDPEYDLVDVAAARTKGITPIEWH